MKSLIKIILICFLISIFQLNVAASELGVDELYNITSEETKDNLKALGIENSVDMLDLQFDNIIGFLSSIFKERYISPFKCFALSIVVIVLTSFLGAWKKESEDFCYMSGAITVCTIYIPYISKEIVMATKTTESIVVFVMASLPVYALLHIASGSVALGASYGGISLVAANFYAELCNKFVLPTLSIFLGISVSTCFSHINIKSIAENIYKVLKWAMVFCVTAFSGIVSVQSAVAGATDVASTKTIKFIAGSTIPVVGTAFADGVTAIRYSVSVLKSGAGAFGIIACVCIFLPFVIEILLWMLSCQITQICADILEAKQISEFISIILVVLKIIMAVILSISIISIVTSAITLVYGA